MVPILDQLELTRWCTSKILLCQNSGKDKKK